MPASTSLSASVPFSAEPRTASIRCGSTRRAETKAVATRSSYCSGDETSAGLTSVLRVRIFMASGPPRGSDPRPELDVLGVEAARDRVGLRDDAALDQDRERLLEGEHAVAHPGDERVAELVGLALLDEVAHRRRGDQDLVRRGHSATDLRYEP